jgi:hypothetical protein
LYAGDRLLRESEGHGQRAHQPVADIHRAAAHPLQHARLGQRAAGDPRQNHGLLWPNVIQHPQDLDLEFLDPVAREHGFPDALHPGPDILKRKNPDLRRQDSRQQETAEEAHTYSLSEGRAARPRRTGVTGRSI